jgi:Tol biopolymer transport system component
MGVLAFVSYDPDASQAELHLLRAGAGEPSKLYVPEERSVIFSPVWSPDGSRIALIVADSGKLPLKPGQSSLGHVWMVDAASGATQLVSLGGARDASISPLAGVVEYPAWRPDGGAVAYVTQDFITTVRPLNEDHPSDQMLGCVSPRWSPRRGGACAVTRSGGEFDISEGDYNDVFRPEVRYDLYPGIPTTGQAPSWLLGLGGLNAYPTFSPDGHWLAWSHRDAGASTIVASPPGDPVLDQNKDIAGYRRPDKVEPGPGLRPEWAPTGLRLAFSDGLPGWFRQLLGATHVGDTAGEIWLYDAETRTRKNLSIHPANDSFPAWSPDGRWIAFVSDRDDPLGEIYVVRTDGTGLRRLTHNHRAEAQPAWRPE